MKPESEAAPKLARSEWPKWVRFSLWGLPSRGWAVACAALSVVIAITSAGLALNLDDTRFWWGLLVTIAAPVYLRAGAWADANGTWG